MTPIPDQRRQEEDRREAREEEESRRRGRRRRRRPGGRLHPGEAAPEGGPGLPGAGGHGLRHAGGRHRHHGKHGRIPALQPEQKPGGAGNIVHGNMHI